MLDDRLYLRVIVALMQALDLYKSATSKLQEGVLNTFFIGGRTLMTNNASKTMNASVDQVQFTLNRPVNVVTDAFDMSLFSAQSAGETPTDNDRLGCMQMPAK